MNIKHAGFIILFAILLLNVSSAESQEKPDDEKMKQATEFYQKGESLYEQEKYNEAIEMYQNANKILPHPNNIYNMAKCHEKLSDYDNAIRYYELYIVEYRNTEKMEPPELKNIKDTIALLKDKAFLSLPEVSINSDPPGSNIYLDDEKKIIGQTPFTTHLNFGNHTLKLSLDGFEPYSTAFEIKAREPMRLHFKMVKSQKMGGLKFSVNVKKARIYVDGKVIGVSPYSDIAPVSEGKHQILIEKDRYSQSISNVYVGTGENVNIKAELFLQNPPYSWRGYLGWAASGIGLGSIGVSLFLFRPMADNEYKGTSNFNKFKWLTYSGYIAGGTVLASGIGLIIWEYARKVVETEELAADSLSQSGSFGILPADGLVFFKTVKF